MSGFAWRSLTLAVAALALAGCAADSGLVSEGDVLVVDVFSGRENPQFALSAGDANAINEAIAACGDFAPSQPVEDPALGFRGFAIQTDTDVVVVRADGVWLTGGDGTSSCKGTKPFATLVDVATPHVENLAGLIAPD